MTITLTPEEIVTRFQEAKKSGNEGEERKYLDMFINEHKTKDLPLLRKMYLAKFPGYKFHLDDIEQGFYERIIDKRNILYNYNPRYYQHRPGDGPFRYLRVVFNTYSIDYHRALERKDKDILPDDISEYEHLASSSFDMHERLAFTETLKEHLDMINSLRYSEDIEDKLLAYQYIRVIDKLIASSAPKDRNDRQLMWDLVGMRLTSILEYFEDTYREYFHPLVIPKPLYFNSVMFQRLTDKGINYVLRGTATLVSDCGQWISDVNKYIRKHMRQAIKDRLDQLN